MGSAVLLVLFIAFFFVGFFLILLFGYRSAEDERARAGAEAAGREPAPERDPGSLRGLVTSVVGEGRPATAGAVLVRRVVDRVEEFLRGERIAAAGFVARPTAEGLFASSGRARAVEACVADLERHVRAEERIVAGFATSPSPDLFARASARDFDRVRLS